MGPTITVSGPPCGIAERLNGTAIDCLPGQEQTLATGDSGSPSMSAASSLHHSRQRCGSISASMSNSSDSASLRSGGAASWQASVRSGMSKEKGGGLWSRRGSVAPKSLRSTRSKGSTRSGHREGSITSGSDQAFEMTAVPLGGRGKKKVLIENEAARQNRAKADAAMAKWRKWIVEEQPRAEFDNPLHSVRSTSISLGPNAGPSNEYPPLRSATPSAPPSALPAHLLSSPPGSSRQNWADTVGTASSMRSYASAGSSHNHPSSSSQHHHLPGVQDIYTTEAVRQLRDVELAIDPAFYGQGSVSGRRLSTHPRMSERENPFHPIHALILRRGIRPFVLELVQALGAFIDAVWSVCHPGKPCPWAGVPQVSRRPSFAGTLQQSKSWCSWTLAAVQEGKRQGFLNNPPTEKDVTFWNREVRYGLRDIDEAVNRRKDLGWAFGKTVIDGQYGDIVASNVFAPDGISAGNIARLLNDLEEVLWGDAIPAPSDLAYEHDPDFDPFSVYREGDELIGVEIPRQPEVREAELRRVFGDFLPSQAMPPTSPVSPVPPGTRRSSRSGRNSLATSPRNSVGHGRQARNSVSQPGDDNMSDLDMSALGALQDLSLEEKLELGRKRHQEYLERVRAESGR